MKNPLYSPEAFVETDFERLAAFLRNHSFGMLISVREGAPMVSHLPLLFEIEAGPRGRLLGHLARANPHAGSLAGGEPVLVIFQGPQDYVSPSWYATEGGVPTWNYAVVHAHGVPRLIEDPAECGDILRRTTAAFESRLPVPWVFDASDKGRARLLPMIVGLEIAVTELRGKFRLSQNRSPEDRTRVIERLGQAGSARAAELAGLMADYLAREHGERP